MSNYEVCGWIGAVLVLVAYYLVTVGKVKADSMYFQLINILGASLLVLYTYHCHAFASMIVNLIWIVIGFTSVFKLTENQKKIIKSKKTRLIGFILTILALGSTQVANSQDTSDIDYEGSTQDSEVIETDSSEAVIDQTTSDEDSVLDE